jgi:uncharacterized protein (DUF2147 family)
LRRLFYSALWSLFGLVAAHAATSPAPTGRWITANHNAVIQITPCGGDLCGQIVGIMLAHPHDAMPLAWTGQPQCGMVILQTAPSPGTGAWIGSVLDPRNGSVYQAHMELDSYRRLILHGYVGLPIFGQTQVWTPYNGQTLAGCRVTDDEGRAITKNG